MPLAGRAVLSVLPLLAMPGLAEAQDWTESSVIEQFLKQSPYAREFRSRVASAEAQAHGRALYSNPVFNYSHESAGLTEFFRIEQTLPITGRRKLLREAGAASIRATEADGAFDLWQARNALRTAFYRVLAGQERQTAYSATLSEIDKVIGVLRTREREGEGSRFDRLRTERERAEILAEMALQLAGTELDRARLLAFLPPDFPVIAVSGQLEPPPLSLEKAALLSRATAARSDIRAEQQRLEQYRAEVRAAQRLRLPEPVVNAGMKRAETFVNRIENGPVVGISLPLPLFNKGQTEVARFTAEQSRTESRLQILTREVQASVEGTLRAYEVRVGTRNQYRKELGETGPELIRIATVAYQEGEIGILQLLDAYRSQRQAQLRMIDIQLAVKEAQIELERVVGEELSE